MKFVGLIKAADPVFVLGVRVIASIVAVAVAVARRRPMSCLAVASVVDR